jgi:predicted DNA-binding protein
MQLKDGRRVRRTTMLLGEELARRLDVFAASRGVDKAVVVNAALEKWLSEQGA